MKIPRGASVADGKRERSWPEDGKRSSFRTGRIELYERTGGGGRREKIAGKKPTWRGRGGMLRARPRWKCCVLRYTALHAPSEASQATRSAFPQTQAPTKEAKGRADPAPLIRATRSAAPPNRGANEGSHGLCETDSAISSDGTDAVREGVNGGRQPRVAGANGRREGSGAVGQTGRKKSGEETGPAEIPNRTINHTSHSCRAQHAAKTARRTSGDEAKFETHPRSARGVCLATLRRIYSSHLA